MPFLSVHAQVKMQGESLLRLVVFSPERAEYQLAGFNRPLVKVIDYRPASVEAMARVLSAGKNSQFLARFNLPARVALWAAYPREIRLELHETAQAEPPYTLHIAPGAPAAQPLYPCLFSHSTPPGSANRMLLLLYRLIETEKTGALAASLAA
jgi:hypothetical protein